MGKFITKTLFTKYNSLLKATFEYYSFSTIF